MTHQVKGVVSQCTQRDQKTRNGMATIHGYIVDGIEVETGFRKTRFDGEMVTTAVKWDYGKWNEIAGDGAGMPAATAGGPGGSAGGAKKGGFGGAGRSRGTFPVDPKDGSISIIRQNSLTHAVNAVGEMIGMNLIEAKTDEEYLKHVIQTALVFTDFSSGQDIAGLQELQKAAAANKAVMDE